MASTTRQPEERSATDPFQERVPDSLREELQLFGSPFQFDSHSHELMQLVRAAFLGLPQHKLLPGERCQIRLRLISRKRPTATPEPPPMRMHSGPGLLSGMMDAENFVVLAPIEHTALVVVSKDMLRFPYHVRYELIEFAAFTLASRALGLVPLHAACVGRSGRGLLLLGPSGAGKSTLALHSCLGGLEFLAEDAVFVKPDGMLATGISNFLHLRRDSPALLEESDLSSRLRASPIIRRRSGVEKFELDLRRPEYRLAAAPLEIVGVVFVSAGRDSDRASLKSLSQDTLIARITTAQPYAAQLPTWDAFKTHLAGVQAFALRRGRHPDEAVSALQSLL
jgi:hypothetical protein